jgi:O-antigen ligase
LALVTALVVARPLVLGEDPGLLDRLSSASGLLLSMLWFVAAVAYAGWRAYFRQEVPGRCLVEWGLAGVVVLVFVSARGAARYQHPALLIAWEWVVLLLAFGLVRRLARSAEDCRGLLAAVLATGVALSAHAIYQSVYEMKQNRQLAEDPERLREAGTKLFGPMEPNDPRLENLKQRLLMEHVFATYAHPNSFAGYLALLMPAAVGGVALLGRRWCYPMGGLPQERPNRGTQALLAAGCAFLMILALWLTHSRGAILGVLMVGLAVYLLRPKATGAARKDLLLGAGVLVLLTFTWFQFPSVAAKAWRSIGLRTEYWTATWTMIGDHPWLGVGPGNFGRHYPRYMAATAFEKIQDPHNFILEIWATCGLFALLALAATLAVFFFRVWSAVRSPWSEPRPIGSEEAARRSLSVAALTMGYGPSPGGDFYFAGMAGLILGFIIKAGDLSADDLLPEVLLSCVRSLIWFAVFALFNGVPRNDRSMALAVSAGVAALLLNLGISGGIALPSVAQPLWVMAALALASAPGASSRITPGNWLYWWVPVPLLAGLGLAYLLLVFSPVTACQTALALARSNYGDDPNLRGWRNQIFPEWEAQIQRGNPAEKSAESRRAGRLLTEHILRPLQKAALADPGDSTPLLELASWYGEEAKILPGRKEPYESGLNHLRQARGLDPANKQVYLTEYQLLRPMAKQFPNNEKTHRLQAAYALKAAVELDPTEARLHYELAEAWFLADDQVKGREQAALAHALDEQAIVAGRHLTDPQRQQIQKWLKPATRD